MYPLYNVWEFCFCSYMNDENFLLVIMMLPIFICKLQNIHIILNVFGTHPAFA